MTRRLFIYSSEFIRAICKTNAELRRLRLTTCVFQFVRVAAKIRQRSLSRVALCVRDMKSSHSDKI